MGTTFTQADFDHLIRDRNNWGRWGADDQRGALNLVTPEKKVAAAGLVRDGRSVSLSKVFPKDPGPTNPLPAQHFMRREYFEHEGAVIDHVGISYHGFASTHVDALCHVWSDDRMWNDRDPDAEVDSFGAQWGGVEQWAEGIVTRGVLLDVPGFRGEPYVTVDKPVRGDELGEIAKAQGTPVEPGDALLVYSGREVWDTEHTLWGLPGGERPGLHADCLGFLRDHDVAALGWDMLDATPNEYRYRHTVHCAISAFGVAVVDNCELGGLARTCRDLSRYEFMFVVAPLVIVGGTGSPANPLALL